VRTAARPSDLDDQAPRLCPPLPFLRTITRWNFFSVSDEAPVQVVFPVFNRHSLTGFAPESLKTVWLGVLFESIPGHSLLAFELQPHYMFLLSPPPAVFIFFPLSESNTVHSFFFLPPVASVYTFCHLRNPGGPGSLPSPPGTPLLPLGLSPIFPSFGCC